MKRPITFITDIIINGTVLYGIFLAILFMVLTIMPAQAFFWYKSVEPVVVPVEIGSTYIIFESDRHIYFSGNLRWNDILRCRVEGGEFGFYSDYPTGPAFITDDGDNTKLWYYRGKIPDEATRCYLESTITRELPFGITKQQTLNSQEFDII